MRPFIPVDISMKETSELSKSVAADLSVPDPTPIVPQKKKKESENNENSKEYDRGASGIDNNTDINPSGQ